MNQSFFNQANSDGGSIVMRNSGTIIRFILLIVCLGLVVFGQKTIGKPYLLMELVGLAGLLGLLWDYNRKYV